MDAVNSLIVEWGDLFWTWIVLPIVVGLGLYFTVRSGVVQIRLFPEMFRTLTDKTPRTTDGAPQSVSSFQAFTISAASRVGVGNIAGVGTAIALGGPGAVFWMWLMALIGASSSFIESSLAQLFKVRDAEGGFRGGPAYYMQRGLRARWMGVLFAVILLICFPFAFSSLQANTIADTVSSSFGTDAGWVGPVTGVVVALLTALVVFGGIRRIASVTQTLVPLMALAYLLLGLAVVAIHIDQLPVVFAEIFVSTLGEWSNIALSIIIFLLAFSSILGNYYYGQSNIEFITTRRGVLPAYRVAVVLAVLVGSLASADLVWSFADGIMGVMALVNLVAIALLSGIAFRLLRDYTRQRREGRDPVFTRDLLPGVTGVECWEDELTVTGPLDLITKKRQSQKHRDHLHGAQQ